MVPEAFDVIVLGGGPGGYVAALRAAAVGLKTALVEKNRLGGVCLNRGCIPTKALIADAYLFDKASRGGAVEFQAPPSFNSAVAVGRSQRVVSVLTKGVDQLLGKRGVEVVRGRGEVTQKGLVVVRAEDGGRELGCRHLVLATGSEPFFPSGLEPDHERVLSSDDVLEGGVFPSGAVAVVGGGIIGMEFACLFAMAGCRVTVVELLPEVLGGVEPDLKKELLRAFRKRRVKILTGTKVEDVKRDGNGVSLALSSGEALEVDFVLVAVGRRAVLEGIEPGVLGIELNEQKRIRVNDAGLAAECVYAIGDAAGSAPMLAHAASHQGVTAIDHIVGGGTYHTPPVPSVIYTKPELASVGIGEAGAREKYGDAVKVGRFPMRALGRAHTVDEVDGFVKVVAEPGGRIVGVHIVGAEASELAGMGLVLVNEDVTLDALARTPMPHPSFSEALMEAAWAALGAPIHIP